MRAHFERTGNFVADRKETIQKSNSHLASQSLPLVPMSTSFHYKKKSLILSVHWEDKQWPVQVEGDDRMADESMTSGMCPPRLPTLLLLFPWIQPYTSQQLQTLHTTSDKFVSFQCKMFLYL